MSQRQPNGLAWALLALTIVLLTANVVLGLTGGAAWTGVFGFIPVTLAFALVGALIAVRAGNRLGWLFLAGATVTAFSVAAKTYAARIPADALPGAAWAGWVLDRVPGGHGAVLVPDSAAVPGWPSAVATVAAGGVDRGRCRGSRDGVLGDLRCQLLLELPAAA